MFAFPLEVLVHCVLHRVNSFLEARVPVVFHGVVRTAHELLGNEAPLLGALVAKDEQDPLLFLRPFCPLDFGIEVVEPALSARFATSAIESFGQVAPHHVLVALALLVDVAKDDFVLLRRPVADRVGRRFLQLRLHYT